MASQEKADIPKMRVCMVLSIAVQGQDMRVPLDIASPVAGFSRLANLGHEVTWIVGVRSEAQDQVQALFPNNAHVYVIPEIRYFRGDSIATRQGCPRRLE